MSADERRDSLAAAFIHLARDLGRVPTTAEIAAAAGVAEGTIFRVHASKEDLLDDAIQVAFCPVVLQRLFDAIDRTPPMRDRLVAVVRIVQDRFANVFGLMEALRLTEPPTHGRHDACIAAGHHVRSAPDGIRGPSHHDAFVSVEDLVDPSAVDVTPAELLHLLRLLTFSGSHPGISHGQTLTAEQIVDTILHGVAHAKSG